jgi:hypothetical protein
MMRPSVGAQQVQAAEVRLEYAQHYGIPYPRLHHASQFKRRYILDAPSPDAAAGARVPSARSARLPLLCLR